MGRAYDLSVVVSVATVTQFASSTRTTGGRTRAECATPYLGLVVALDAHDLAGANPSTVLESWHRSPILGRHVGKQDS